MRAYTKGDRVSQPQYGAGTITDVTDRYTVIDFDEHGVRTFVTSLVTLEATNAPAPTDRPRRTARKRTRKTAASS